MTKDTVQFFDHLTDYFCVILDDNSDKEDNMVNLLTWSREDLVRAKNLIDMAIAEKNRNE